MREINIARKTVVTERKKPQIKFTADSGLTIDIGLSSANKAYIETKCFLGVSQYYLQTI